MTYIPAPAMESSGDGALREATWWNHTLGACHNDDALWGYSIRFAEQMKYLQRTAPGRLGDPVLFRLINMGLYDWKDDDSRMNQGTGMVLHWLYPADQSL